MEDQHSPTSETTEETTSALSTSLETSEEVSSPPAAAEQAEAAPGASTTTPQAQAPTAPSPTQEASDRWTAALARLHALPQPWHTLTRRQMLTGIGIVVGMAAVGTGTTLAILSGSSSPDSSSSPSSSSSPGAVSTVGLPPAQTPVSEDKLHAWRTKQLTAQPGQRFTHQRGTTLVPLGVVEATYPNPYNPYHIHLQGYVLGGALVARTQFFLYLGLASLDGSQFVAKVRVGPVDQPSKTFGLLVVQQTSDAIEGGPAEFPQVTLAPRAIYRALPALANHCIELVFIRQPLPTTENGIPAEMLPELGRQALISDQFLQVDYEAVHHTPLAALPDSDVAPIRHLIDTSPITYHPATDASRYPLVTQLILRHTDQLYSKLIPGR